MIHPRENDLVIGTFGRAAWVLDDIRPLRALAKNKEVFNPTAYQAAYQQPTGSRFGADAMYNGENRSFGAQLSYYVKIDEKKADDKDKKKDDEDNEENSEKDKTKVKWDSITMTIYDGDRLIRTLKEKAPDSTGIYKSVCFSKTRHL